jgi:hypothetical protein
MNPHVWMGADAVFMQQGANAVARLPSILELLTSIHALDAEIRQTDYEIAAQTSQAPLREAAFVDKYWRPFVSYWGHAMQEVYAYERRALGDRSASHSPNLAAAAMSLWGARSKYYDLRREALNWGFSLHPSPSAGF